MTTGHEITESWIDEHPTEKVIVSNRHIRARTRYAKHTGGTKWYRVTLMEDINEEGLPVGQKLIKSWGSTSNSAVQCKVEDYASINDYEKALNEKRRWRNKGRYEFDKEESVKAHVKDHANNVARTMAQSLGLLGARRFAATYTAMQNFLEPMPSEFQFKEAPRQAAVDFTVIEDKNEYGSEWGAFS